VPIYYSENGSTDIPRIIKKSSMGKAKQSNKKNNLNSKYPFLAKSSTLTWDRHVYYIDTRLLNRDGVDMKAYTVYRVEHLTNKTEAVGKVVERRRGERYNNASDMLKLAQKLYEMSSIDSHVIIIREDYSHRGL
jgi:hypothetical protein